MKDLSMIDSVEVPHDAVEFSFSGSVFAVTPRGEIYKHKKTKTESKWVELSTNIGQDGRVKALITSNRKTKSIDIAKTIVSVIFGEDKGRTWSVNFIDDDPMNLNIENLCWQKFMGRNGRGEKIPVMSE